MDIRSLRILESVARHRSFSKAADEICLSTAAVSAAVIKAEEQIGLPLFERTTRYVCPTPLIERMLPRIRLLIKDYDSLLSEITETVRSRTGRVAIGCLSSIAVRIIPKVIAHCRALYPEVEIEIRDAAAGAVYGDVADGLTDFALVGAFAFRGEMEFVPLLDDPLVLICPSSHVLAQHTHVDIEQLQRYEFILLSKETGVRSVLESTIGPMDERFVVKQEVTQISSLIGMVEEGLGISFVPLLSVPQSRSSALAVIEDISPKISRQIGMLRRTDRPLTPPAQAAMACVRLALSRHVST